MPQSIFLLASNLGEKMPGATTTTAGPSKDALERLLADYRAHQLVAKSQGVPMPSAAAFQQSLLQALPQFQQVMQTSALTAALKKGLPGQPDAKVDVSPESAALIKMLQGGLTSGTVPSPYSDQPLDTGNVQACVAQGGTWTPDGCMYPVPGAPAAPESTILGLPAKQVAIGAAVVGGVALVALLLK